MIDLIGMIAAIFVLGALGVALRVGVTTHPTAKRMPEWACGDTGGHDWRLADSMGYPSDPSWKCDRCGRWAHDSEVLGEGE